MKTDTNETGGARVSCPFCGGHLIAISDDGQQVEWHPSSSDCFLAGMMIRTPEQQRLWNKRQPSPQPAREAVGECPATCARCGARNNEQAETMCRPGEDDCPMCFQDDWPTVAQVLQRYGPMAPPAASAEPMPRVCCGEFATCTRACTPRGRWQIDPQRANGDTVPAASAEAVAEVAEAARDALEFLTERFGNNEGLDWHDDQAGFIGDKLDNALAALSTKEGGKG